EIVDWGQNPTARLAFHYYEPSERILDYYEQVATPVALVSLSIREWAAATPPTTPREPRFGGGLRSSDHRKSTAAEAVNARDHAASSSGGCGRASSGRMELLVGTCSVVGDAGVDRRQPADRGPIEAIASVRKQRQEPIAQHARKRHRHACILSGRQREPHVLEAQRRFEAGRLEAA